MSAAKRRFAATAASVSVPFEDKGEPNRRMKGTHYETRGNPIENIGVPIRNQGGGANKGMKGIHSEARGDPWRNEGGPIRKPGET